jgi:RHS repeat-associated protein
VQKHKRTAADTELSIKDAFTYSAQDRLLTHTHQINGGTVQLLADNTYDELGKLISKKVGNTSATPLQKVDYAYNIRGWMKTINNPTALQQGTDPADLFGFKMNYNTVDGNTAVANKLYNGNIAETFWSTATDGGFVRNYGYKYDQLNRLKDATYQKSGQVTGMYDENLSYDKNGNIMNLSRYGDRDEQYLPIQIDNLQYGYATNSNKLMSVVDNSNNTSGFKDGITTGDDYVYDANGNMTVDKNKKIASIVYNHLNLPTKIVFPTGNIVYFYTASGQKVQKVVTENTTITTTDYLGGYHYKNAVLQFFPTAEGYVKNTPVSGTNTYSYVFNYTDHLGNVRLSYTKNPSTNALDIIEESNYYPFGLKHNSYNVDNYQPEYKYQYNGKEMQDELQLNLYDFGARNYDPVLGRWMNVDPLAEKMRRHSPYNYAFNNPIYFIDPDGMQADDWINWTGKDGQQHITYHEGITTLDQAKANGYSTATQVFKSGVGNIKKTREEFNFQAGGKFSVNGGKTMDVADGGYQTEGGAYINKGLTNSEQILKVSSGLQDGGDSIALAGYSLTSSVVGAPIGIPMATVGNIISGLGTITETGIVIHNALKNEGSLDKAKENIGVYAVGKVINHYIGKAGFEGVGEEIAKQNVSLKLTGAQRLYDTKKEENKNKKKQ